MSVKQAHITTKELRSIKLARIPVVEDGESVAPLQYTEIGGALLVPVTDAKLFNSSKSTIRRAFERGTMTPYHGNGVVKTNNRSTRVYFDLYEYMNMNKNKDY